MTAGRQRIQLISDTTYPEMAVRPSRLRARSPSTAPPLSRRQSTCHLGSDPPATDQRLPGPLPGFGELAGAARDSGTDRSLDHWSVVKGLSQEQREGRAAQGAVGEGVLSSLPPQGPLSPHLHVLTDPGLLGFYGGFNAWTRLMKSLATGD